MRDCAPSSNARAAWSPDLLFGITSAYLFFFRTPISMGAPSFAPSEVVWTKPPINLRQKMAPLIVSRVTGP